MCFCNYSPISAPFITKLLKRIVCSPTESLTCHFVVLFLNLSSFYYSPLGVSHVGQSTWICLGLRSALGMCASHSPALPLQSVFLLHHFTNCSLTLSRSYVTLVTNPLVSSRFTQYLCRIWHSCLLPPLQNTFFTCLLGHQSLLIFLLPHSSLLSIGDPWLCPGISSL